MPAEEVESKDDKEGSSTTAAEIRSARILNSLIGQDGPESALDSRTPAVAAATARQNEGESNPLEQPDGDATAALTALMTEGEQLFSRLPSSQAQQVTALLSGSSSPVARALHACIAATEIGAIEDRQSEARGSAESGTEPAQGKDGTEATCPESPSSTLASPAETRNALEARRRRIIGKQTSGARGHGPTSFWPLAGPRRTVTRAGAEAGRSPDYQSAFARKPQPIDDDKEAFLLQNEGVRLYGWSCARNFKSIIEGFTLDPCHGGEYFSDDGDSCASGSEGAQLAAPEPSREGGGRPTKWSGQSKASAGSRSSARVGARQQSAASAAASIDSRGKRKQVQRRSDTFRKPLLLPDALQA